MDSIKPLFTAVGSVTGGRNGHGEAADHSVSVDLSVPKAMGGPGRPNTTTPEHLFAVGYAACFGGALDFVAVQKKKNAKGASVTCSVSIGPRDAGGFGIAVKLHVKDATLPQAELEALAREAHEKICPYSHATRGNVDVTLSYVGMQGSSYPINLVFLWTGGPHEAVMNISLKPGSGVSVRQLTDKLRKVLPDGVLRT